MKYNPRNKQERINLRLQQDTKRTLEQAASVKDESLSHFVVAAAMAKAEQVISEHNRLHLRQADSKLFFDALVNPPPFNKKLMMAFDEHARRVKNDES